MKKEPVIILVDSTCMFSEAELQNTLLSVIPFHILVNKKSYDDLPDIVKTKSIFKNILQQVKIQEINTSQTNRQKFINKVQQLLTKYQTIIYFCVNPILSSQYNSTSLISKQPDFKNRLWVVPIKNAGWGHRLLACKAHELAKKKVNYHAIIEEIKQHDLYLMKTFIVVGDNNVFAQSGRSKKFFAKLLAKTNLKIILRLDKKIVWLKRTMKSVCHLIYQQTLKMKHKLNIYPVIIIGSYWHYQDNQMQQLIMKNLQSYDRNLVISFIKQPIISPYVHCGFNSFSFVIVHPDLANNNHI